MAFNLFEVFDIMKIFEDETFVSPGSLGGKIKKYRELRGLSQKELGIRCGFSPNTADVRIAQYEKNKKIPREKALSDITKALELDECALFDADLLVYNRMYHALFEIEDFHGLHPVKKDDGYYLEFEGPTVIGTSVSPYDFQDFLKKWYEMRQKCMVNTSDSEEEKERKAKEYALWRGEYPMNEARKMAQRMRDSMREHRLQAELDELYAKRNSESELKRIDKELEEIMPKIKSSYEPIQKESDFIFLIKDAIEKGLKIERFTPEEQLERDYDFNHLLSIKGEDITKDEESKSLYARIVCAVETMQQHGINIIQTVTSKDKVLYVTYKYPSSQYRYFENLSHSWEDIIFIVDRIPWWSKSEIDELEEKFRIKVTDKRDVSFLGTEEEDK